MEAHSLGILYDVISFRLRLQSALNALFQGTYSSTNLFLLTQPLNEANQ